MMKRQLEEYNEQKQWNNVIFGVSTSGLHFLISGDDELKQFMDGSLFEDNSQSIEKFPTKPGVYRCTIEYWFEQGYFEGWRADGESEWDFVPSDIEEIDISGEG